MLLILTMLAMQTTQAAPPAPAPKKERKLCRSEVTTGSLLGHSVCHTRAEWTEIDDAQGQRRDNFRDQTTNPGLPSLSGRAG